MLRKILHCSVLILTISLGTSGASSLAADELQLSLRRDFGFGLGNQVQGKLRLVVSASQPLRLVSIEMDGDQMARLEEAPFQWVFETGNFPPGLHRLSAAAVTVSGRELRSPVLTAEFLSKPEATRKTMLLIVPVLAVVFLVVGLGVLLQLRKGNSQEYQGGSYRNFGWNGGAICPKCRKPFARHLLSLNFLTRKLERCPYCGKWALVGRASLKELEAADLAATHQEKGATAPPRDDWGRKLEDSKYL